MHILVLCRRSIDSYDFRKPFPLQLQNTLYKKRSKITKVTLFQICTISRRYIGVQIKRMSECAIGWKDVNRSPIENGTEIC